MVMRRLRIPHIIGMILAGVVIGPHAANVLDRDSSFEIFGQVGLYYIMFLAALEMDTRALVKNVGKYLMFGIATFLIPFILAWGASRMFLHYTPQQSLLFSALLSSNTLIAYPIISRYGLGRKKSVSLSVGGSMIALLLSLIIVAGIATSFEDDDVVMAWSLFAIKIIAFGVVMILFVPRLTRVFLRYYSDSVTQFIYVLGIMFLSSALAEVCGIEGVLGAFIAGLIMNRYIPHVSPLMNRIEFVGNALFIPYFLIGVGMLIDIKTMYHGIKTWQIVGIMVIVGTIGKALAAYLTSWVLHMKKNDGTMIFGLTSAHAAGAIAIIMVGMRLETAPGKYLMDNGILNGVVIMILITCIISGMVTESAARRTALEDKREDDSAETTDADDEKILLPVKSEASAEHLLDLGAMMCNHSLNRGLIALNVVYDDADSGVHQREGRIMLERMMKQAAGMDVRIQTQSRLASNVANGIVHAFKEYDASELIVGCNGFESPRANSLGNTLDSLISQLNRQIIITRIFRPLNTIRMIDVVVPQKAEYEQGFYRWTERLARLAENLSCRMTFHCSGRPAQMIANYMAHRHTDVTFTIEEFTSSDNIQELNIKEDHLLVLIVARRGTLSYSSYFEKLPTVISQTYPQHSILMLFPDQYGLPIDEITFTAPLAQDEKSGWAILRRFFTKRK